MADKPMRNRLTRTTRTEPKKPKITQTTRTKPKEPSDYPRRRPGR